MSDGNIDTFDLGDRFKATVTFTDDNGTAADPTTVTFTVRQPDGTDTDYVYGTASEVTKTATGAYKLLLTASSAGLWAVRVKGTGTVVAADEGLFAVAAGNF